MFEIKTTQRLDFGVVSILVIQCTHFNPFSRQVAVAGKEAFGEGSNKKVAKTEAAKAMLLLLDGVDQERAQCVSHIDFGKIVGY